MEFTSLAKRIKLEEQESEGNGTENTDYDELIIKLEPVDDGEEMTEEKNVIFEKEIEFEPLWENVEEELLDDEYFEMNIPKLEPYETEDTETDTSFSCLNEVNTQEETNKKYNKIVKKVLHLEPDHNVAAENSKVPSRAMKPSNNYRRCQLCKTSQNRNVLKNATAENTRLILISVCYNDFTTTQAMEFMNAATCNVCFSHFSVAITQLQEYLSQPQKMNELMKIVNVFRPSMTIKQFRINSAKFVHKNSKTVSNEKMLENVEEELLDDEYFETNVPKREPNCIEKGYTEQLKPEFEESVAPKEVKTPRNRMCQLCEKLENVKNMKCVKTEYSRLILILVHKDFFTTTAEATQFLNMPISCICSVHFPVAVSKLQRWLSHPQKMEELMDLVNYFRPNMTITDFRYHSKLFIYQHQRAAVKKDVVFRTEKVKLPKSKACVICKQNTDDVIAERKKSAKLVVMIGCVLRGTHPIEYAKSFVSNARCSHPVCDSHFGTSMDEICKALRIQSHRDLHCCQMSDVEKLMEIVNSLYPEMQWIQFHNLLIELGTRTGKFKMTNNAS